MRRIISVVSRNNYKSSSRVKVKSSSGFLLFFSKICHILFIKWIIVYIGYLTWRNDIYYMPYVTD